MPPCQATENRSNAQEQEHCWGDSSNASLLRQDSLAYSVSDCGSANYFEDFMDESFETYCDRMDSKEVVVIFDNGFHPSVICQGQQQAIDQDMMDKVKNMRISSQQQQDRPAQKHGNDHQAWQFPQSVSNYKENSHGAGFHQMRRSSQHTAMAS
jgi:hypothetical protein